MNILLSVFTIVALALVLSVFLILLPVAIIFNSRAGRKYRTELAKKIHALRLGKMLTALGIDTEEYLSTERVVDIYQHIKRCGECTNLGLCDEGLADGTIEAGSIDFCNNKQALRKIVDK